VGAVFATLLFVQTQTSFGIRVFAVGGNREASRLSAIPVDRVVLLCFVITGLAVGLGGLVLTARVQSGQPNAGGTLALIAIAAIVVGGNNLLGGRGSITRTLWGVLLLAVLENGLQLEGVNTDVQQVIIGAVFIAAASAEFFRRRLRSRGRAAEEAELLATGGGPFRDLLESLGAWDHSQPPELVPVADWITRLARGPRGLVVHATHIGRDTTAQDISDAVEDIVQAVTRIRDLEAA
jgi:hypothetical protein